MQRAERREHRVAALGTAARDREGRTAADLHPLPVRIAGGQGHHHPAHLGVIAEPLKPCARTGTPHRGRYCFGRSAPIRAPTPAAGIAAQTLRIYFAASEVMKKPTVFLRPLGGRFDDLVKTSPSWIMPISVRSPLLDGL